MLSTCSVPTFHLVWGSATEHGGRIPHRELGYIVVLSDIDRRLVTRCIESVPGAWEDFVERFIALITHVVTETAESRLGQEYIKNPDQIRDDVVAEVFLKLVEKDFAILRKFRGHSSLGTYLVVVTRRIAVKRIVKIGRRLAVPLSTEPVSEAANGELAVENNEEVQSLLAQMPAEEAAAIRMYHLEERSYHDIGAHIGIPENSVGPLLFKARSRLKSLRQA